MFKLSCNVVLVYTLLVVDLLINVFNNLISPTAQLDLPFRLGSSTRDLAFIIVLVQISANVFVAADLALYFLSISDKVKQHAWSQQERTESHGQEAPMPQRRALKLVLDRYWWSLVVSLTYLVTSIELHLIRFNASLHTQAKVSESRENTHSPLRMELQVHTVESGSMASSDRENSIWSSTESENSFEDSNLLPMLLLLFHKLLSTCYYISLVVICRAQTSQIVGRIVASSQKLGCLDRKS